jgi:hypothetical protein
LRGPSDAEAWFPTFSGGLSATDASHHAKNTGETPCLASLVIENKGERPFSGGMSALDPSVLAVARAAGEGGHGQREVIDREIVLLAVERGSLIKADAIESCLDHCLDEAAIGLTALPRCGIDERPVLPADREAESCGLSAGRVTVLVGEVVGVDVLSHSVLSFGASYTGQAFSWIADMSATTRARLMISTMPTVLVPSLRSSLTASILSERG